jgi:hypothetical protein
MYNIKMKGSEVKCSSLLHNKAVEKTASLRRETLIYELSIAIMREKGISSVYNNPMCNAVLRVIWDLLRNGVIKFMEQHKSPVYMGENSENADVISVVTEICNVYINKINNRRFNYE